MSRHPSSCFRDFKTIALATSVTLLIAACGASSTTSGTPPPSPPLQPQIPTSQHVVMVMEENQSYSTVAGKTAVWPHLTALMKQGAQPANYYADGHPSIPNYFMLTT